MEPLDGFFDALADVPNFRSVPLIDVDMRENGNEFTYDGLAAPTGRRRSESGNNIARR